MRPLVPLLALLLGAVLVALRPTFAQAQENAVLTVAVTKPTPRVWPETVQASGWLRPWHEAVVAAEIDGLRVTDVLVDVGSVVARGQPLARLAAETVRADLRKDEAALATASADLAKARANADRARKLQESGALSAEKITEYLIAEQTAAASVESAEASVERRRIELARTTIVANDDGVITSRAVRLGTVVASGTELFRLVRGQRIEWQAEIPARLLARVREGMSASVVGPDDRRIEGTVRLVAPTVSSDTGRALVYVALPTEARPPIGLHVTGEIVLATTAALAVPESAILRRDGFGYVFVLGADRRVSRVRVETGRRDGDEIEILSGLDRSAVIVRSGGAFLSDGALVRAAGEIR